MKKIVIFVAFISALILFNCKDKTLPTAEEQMEKTEIDSVTVKDGVETNEVAPEVAKKDSVAIHPEN
ncbi:MAG: hypothetical protein V4548_05595 [Bacteroidota bacterium]